MNALSNIPPFIALPVAGFIAWFALLGGPAWAQQPDSDSIDLDVNACAFSVEWIDGKEVASKLEVFVNDILVGAHTKTLNDVVGDQSAVILEATGKDGDEILARLSIVEEDPYEVDGELSCPATPTPTATNTPVPPTPTATATATPAPTQTPVIIFIQPPPATATPVPASIVRPPSTGDGGLAD